MSLLAEFLETKLKERSKAYCNGQNQYIVNISKLEPNLILCSYLQKFPLFSSKFLNFQDYYHVLTLIKEKKHKTESGILIINEIKNNLNNKRTGFVWDHLQNMYNLYK
jgi:hypothetical protein